MSELKVDVLCAHCGTSFQVIPSRLKHGRGKYCSPACQYAAKRAAPCKKIVQCICVGCGTAFTRYSSKLEQSKGAGKYCTRECRDLHRVGANVPNWFGAPREYRGPNWQRQKRAARARDNHTCQSCGNVGTDVHHKVPYRLFALGNWEAANGLNNLITLCRPCHRTADALIQQNEIARHVG